MNNRVSKIVSVSNNVASVAVDTLGGAIVDFHLHAGKINPLTFRLPLDGMPENNKTGATYQGHFVCMGCWGQPSAGEIEAGLPNHGQAANLPWTVTAVDNENELHMEVNTPLDGLKINRVLRLDNNSPVFTVSERVKNINPLGRLYNVVQHPTIAAPFLDGHTIVNCNATAGFSCFGDDEMQNRSHWPTGIAEGGMVIDLSNPNKGDNFSVYAFVADKSSNIGWITAWSPTHNLVLGYLWKRTDYPWICLWQDYADGKIKHRGLEFGTTGIHKPFNEILAANHIKVLGENTVTHIDAGQDIERGYCAFLLPVTANFKGVEQIKLDGENILIKTVKSEQMITLNTSFKLQE